MTNVKPEIVEVGRMGLGEPRRSRASPLPLRGRDAGCGEPTFVLCPSEMAVERSIVPRQVEVGNHPLEMGDRRLAHIGEMLLVGRVAEINATTQRAGLPGGAPAPIVLPWAT